MYLLISYFCNKIKVYFLVAITNRTCYIRYMSFSIGQTVEVLQSDGTKEQGVIEIISHSTIWHMGHPSVTAEYGIRTPSHKWLKYYKGSEVSVVPIEERKSLCDCGAVKAALPYPPSGHARYCLLFKEKV